MKLSTNIEKDQFKEDLNTLFLKKLFDNNPKVLRYLSWLDRHLYHSDFTLPYVLIEDITFYFKWLQAEGDYKTMTSIMLIFEEIMCFSDKWRNLILISFCDQIVKFPEVLELILPMIPPKLKIEVLKSVWS